jgi:hypothetical protein
MDETKLAYLGEDPPRSHVVLINPAGHGFPTVVRQSGPLAVDRDFDRKAHGSSSVERPHWCTERNHTGALRDQTSLCCFSWRNAWKYTTNETKGQRSRGRLARAKRRMTLKPHALDEDRHRLRLRALERVGLRSRLDNAYMDAIDRAEQAQLEVLEAERAVARERPM